MKGLLNALAAFSGLVLIWALYVRLSGIEPFLLPGPMQVFETLIERHELILGHLGPTALEIVLGRVHGDEHGGLELDILVIDGDIAA